MILESKLKMLKGIDEAYVDVKAKTIGIKGKIKKEDVIKNIKEAGYNPDD